MIFNASVPPLMFSAFFILLVGLTPSFFSLWMLRRTDDRMHARFRLALESVSTRGLPRVRLLSDQQYVDGLGYVVGDFTCRFNARSSYVRCAVNPFGPCQDCPHYESRL